jgi:hypothetical protein
MDFLTILRQKERGVSEGTLVILPPASLRFRAEYQTFARRNMSVFGPKAEVILHLDYGRRL